MVHDRIADGISDKKTATIFNNNNAIKEALEFTMSCLQKESQPRDGYRELLELSLVYMGHVSPWKIHLVAPGAMHLARWIAKAIYSLKLILFCPNFE